MNLRCIYCQTPFTIGRAEMLNAIVTMNEKNQSHYDAHCPRCRRANSISRQRMELFYPNWKEDAVKQKAQEPVPAAPPPPAPAAAHLPTEPIAKPKAAEKKPAAKTSAKPAAKKSAKPAAAKKTPAKPAAKTTAEKKPAAKKTTASKTTTSAKKPAAPKKK